MPSHLQEVFITPIARKMDGDPAGSLQMNHNIHTFNTSLLYILILEKAQGLQRWLPNALIA